METDGAPEVQPSGQETNPIVLEPALVEPQTDLDQPGDSKVPLDPEECGSEFLIPRSVVSVSVVPTVVAYTGELVRGLNAQVNTYVKSRISKGMEYPTFFPTTLDEARDNLDFPPIPADSLLGTWTERVMSIQQHEESSPSAFNFYHEYGITAEDNLVAFQCVQIITQDHVNRGERSLSGNLPVSLYGTSYVPGGDIARDMAAIARVHPAAMGLVSYYYRLDKAIAAFRKLMTRYEFIPKIEEQATLERQFRIAMLLLRSLLAVIAEVSKLALQIRSGIVSKRKDKLYSFRTADIWHAPSFKTVIWNELALMFWQSSFGAAALDTGIADHPFLYWIEDVTLNIPRDRAESFQHFTELCHSLIDGTTDTNSYIS
jgi:hypothetical protein